MFGMYECGKSSVNFFLPINTLSNVSYFGYRRIMETIKTGVNDADQAENQPPSYSAEVEFERN